MKQPVFAFVRERGTAGHAERKQGVRGGVDYFYISTITGLHGPQIVTTGRRRIESTSSSHTACYVHTRSRWKLRVDRLCTKEHSTFALVYEECFRLASARSQAVRYPKNWRTQGHESEAPEHESTGRKGEHSISTRLPSDGSAL